MAIEDPNILQQASLALDEFLGYTGLPYATGQIGRGVGSGADYLFGTNTLADIGQSVGEGLPRTALEIAPFFLIRSADLYGN